MELEDLIECIDIVEYISQFVDLEERNGEFWGLSPFSNEKTPSFSVNRDSRNFYCFSTGIGGNVFTFVKKYFNCTPTQAVNILREYAGAANCCAPQRVRMVACSVARKFKPKEKKKVCSGAVLPANAMEKYEKAADKLAMWEKEGISRESLDKYQVYYDRFSNCLVYPIRNIKGEIVNIGGRTLCEDYKERKIRKYTYFFGWGGEMNVIYGLYENMSEILARREVIVFEGCKSVLLADTWGIHNTAAILTSHLSPSQLRILTGLGVKVIFALDKEVKIREDRNIAKLKNYTNVEFIWDRWNLLSDKEAPVDRGRDVFLTLYERKVKYI